MWNKELYVREQQDAYEFFTSLIDQMDEYLKVMKAASVLMYKLQDCNGTVEPEICTIPTVLPGSQV